MDNFPDFDEGDLIRRGTILSDKFLAEIGRVVANFAIVERELFALIHGLLGTNNDISRIVTSELSFRNLLDLSASLVKQIHGQKEAERYKAALWLAVDAENERNLIVHSLWGGGGETSVVRTKPTAKRARGLQVQRQEYRPEDLRAAARKIARAIYAIEKFRESLSYRWA